MRLDKEDREPLAKNYEALMTEEKKNEIVFYSTLAKECLTFAQTLHRRCNQHGLTLAPLHPVQILINTAQECATSLTEDELPSALADIDRIIENYDPECAVAAWRYATD
ncbi:hypothetical protein [Entomobacter blattae]|uniref:Uncharacterized protein n=1 Tax=Entomobacter blattae TaxID=2762277 RepID=A0A7H1NR49_9PROT|nr:hypothetical protein [Entomobacter blattae]QNT78259.1 hypothetical protein JGUZn3_10310 [Entomobacter blattae]